MGDLKLAEFLALEKSTHQQLAEIDQELLTLTGQRYSFRIQLKISKIQNLINYAEDIDPVIWTLSIQT